MDEATEIAEREKERRELLAALEGRKVVAVDLDGQTFDDDSQSTDLVTLTLDDGTSVEFSAFWCNDSTADLVWEVKPQEPMRG